MIGAPREDIKGNPMHHDRPIMVKMNCQDKNFPYKCFYDEDDGVVISFYR